MHRLPALGHLRLGLCLVLGAITTTVAESGPLQPTLALEVSAKRSVSGEDAETLEAHLTIRMANAECGFRLAPPGIAPELRLEIDLLTWDRRQEPGGKAVFDTNTGLYRQGVAQEIYVRIEARVIVVATSEILKSKKMSFRQVEKTSANPMFDPMIEVELRSRTRIGRTIKKQLCKVVKEYRKKRE